MTGHICDDCAAGHIVTPATIRLDWDLGSKWLCEDCARGYKLGESGAQGPAENATTT